MKTIRTINSAIELANKIKIKREKLDTVKVKHAKW